MVGNGACAYLRSRAVPLMGGCRERLCEFFVGSLCCGRLQRVGNGACANLRSLAVPLGRCRERSWELFVGSLC